MNVDQLIQKLKKDRSFLDCVTAWEVLPAQEGRYVDFPARMDPRIARVLRQRHPPALHPPGESFAAAISGRTSWW